MSWHNARRWERDSAAKNGLDFWITDESVILRIQTNALGFGGTKAIEVEELIADIRATAGLARTIGEAMAHVPPSAELAQHAPAWRAFAEANGLRFSASPLRVSGSVRRRGVRGARGPRRRRVRRRADDAVRAPAPFYLRLGPRCGWFEIPRSYTDAWAEWVRPQKTGDGAFDQALEVVSAVDTEALTAALSPEVRRALLALRSSHDHVQMSTTSVSVRTRGMVGPEAFAGILRPLSELEKTSSAGRRVEPRMESNRCRPALGSWLWRRSRRSTRPHGSSKASSDACYLVARPIPSVVAQKTPVALVARREYANTSDWIGCEVASTWPQSPSLEIR